MNGNRSKYTYTPTYGMQKRGLSRKSNSVRQIPEAPDFTQVPDPAIGVPLQQMMPQQPVQNPAGVPQSASFSPAYFSSVQQTPVPGPASAPGQYTFAAPAFVQSGQPSQMPAFQQSIPQPAYPQPPIGNTMHRQQEMQVFSTRAQGFIPPQVNNTSPTQPSNGMPPQIGWANPQAATQSIPPFSGIAMNVPPQNNAFQAQNTQAFPPLQPMPQQPGFTVQATAPHASPRVPSLDADRLYSIFLFGVLPLLFIPCLFVSSAWDALRYVFLGSAVAGLGIMWFRQMYSSAVRMIVSIIYVTLCIGIIAMLMQGAHDTRQAAANLAVSQPQVQATQTPAPDAAAAVIAATPSPAPTVSGPSEAERRLDLFMELWKVNNTTEMVNLVQPSWRGQQENAAASLFLALANRTPENFVIEDISGTETDNSRTITMRATINKNTGKAPVVYRFMVMMVKEGGEWYINPNSLATNDAQQTEKQDENVVKTQSSGTVTEPPRETVTPAPPASTLLYYNIGGNYFHMDPECPSVGKDYLPFDASFPYSDLSSYNRDLLPCLNCNAPTDTLD